MSNATSVREYYDKYVGKLVNDFVSGNPRMLAAINFAMSKIPVNAKNVLDIGCGIGWSAHEFARNFEAISVNAYDISPELIATARKMFGFHKNVTFEVADVTDNDYRKSMSNAYDCVTLLDVYEHIPSSERDKFNDTLNDLLSSTGRILITAPTVYHQAYLKANNPSGLQPVDEDIDLTVIEDLASKVGGTITHFEMVSINHRYDYLHVCIERGADEFSKRVYAASPSIQPILTRLLHARRSVAHVPINWRYTIKRLLGIR